MAAIMLDLLGGDGLTTGLLDMLPVAVYTTDRDGLVTYANQAAAEFAGREPVIGHDRWCVSWRLYHTDGRPLRHEECPMAVALKENRIVRGVDAVAERPDGTRVRFMPFPTPICDATGAAAGGINILLDLGNRGAIPEPRPEPVQTHVTLLAMFNVLLRDGGRQARGAEARKLLATMSESVAAISTSIIGFGDLVGPIQGRDIMTTACIAAQRQSRSNLEITTESDACEFEIAMALPVMLIASELIAAIAEHQPIQRKRGVRAELRRRSGCHMLTVAPAGELPRRANPLPLQKHNLIAALARLVDAEFEASDSCFPAPVRFTSDVALISATSVRRRPDPPTCRNAGWRYRRHPNRDKLCATAQGRQQLSELRRNLQVRRPRCVRNICQTTSTPSRIRF